MNAVLKILAAGVATIAMLAGIVLTGWLPASAQADQSATVRLRGAHGSEVVRFYTDTGQALGEQTVGSEWIDIAVAVPSSANLLYVAFVNDSVSSSFDRNLLVDRVVWADGPMVEADSVESKGVFDGTRCDRIAVHGTETLHCNGWFRFEVPGGGGDPTEVVTIRAGGSTGSELMQLELDGDVVAEWTVGTLFDDYTYTHTGAQIAEARVLFTNDGLSASGADRNLAVLSTRIGGQLFDPVDVRSQGVWNGVDCGIGYREGRQLACNGWFEFIIDSVEPPPPPPPPPPEESELTVRAKGSSGSERMTVEADGVVMGEVTVTTDWASYEFNLPEAGFEVVRINFVNDGLTGGGADRNLIVDQLVDHVNGAEVEAESLLSTGVWDGQYCDVEAVHGEEFLACNGWFEYRPETPPPPPDDPGLVRVRLRGATGNETAWLQVNGQRIGPVPVSAEWTQFNVLIDAEIQTVRVFFDNDGRDQDGSDRNLYVDWISVDGVQRETDDLTGAGVWNGLSCNDVAVHGIELLACNGWFEYQVDEPPRNEAIQDWAVSGPMDTDPFDMGPFAALSRAGDAVAFRSGTDPASQTVVIKNMGDGSETVVVADVGLPMFVADGGGVVAYSSGFGLVRQSADGSNREVVFVGSATYSADRTLSRIVVDPARGQPFLWEPGGSTTLLDPPFRHQISGDGDYTFVVSGVGEDPLTLHRIPVDGGSELTVSPVPGRQFVPSADGSKVLFHQQNVTSSTIDITLVDVESGQQSDFNVPFDSVSYPQYNLHYSSSAGGVLITAGQYRGFLALSTGHYAEIPLPPNVVVLDENENGSLQLQVESISEEFQRLSLRFMG